MQSLGKDVGSAAPQYKFSMSTPSIPLGIMERAAWQMTFGALVMNL
jgi:hypothetical protein